MGLNGSSQICNHCFNEKVNGCTCQNYKSLHDLRDIGHVSREKFASTSRQPRIVSGISSTSQCNGRNGREGADLNDLSLRKTLQSE